MSTWPGAENDGGPATLSLTDVEHLTEVERLWLFGEVKRGKYDVSGALQVAKGGTSMVQAIVYGQQLGQTMLATIVPDAIAIAAKLAAATIVVRKHFTLNFLKNSDGTDGPLSY